MDFCWKPQVIFCSLLIVLLLNTVQAKVKEASIFAQSEEVDDGDSNPEKRSISLIMPLIGSLLRGGAGSSGEGGLGGNPGGLLGLIGTALFGGGGSGSGGGRMTSNEDMDDASSDNGGIKIDLNLGRIGRNMANGFDTGKMAGSMGGSLLGGLFQHVARANREPTGYTTSDHPVFQSESSSNQQPTFHLPAFNQLFQQPPSQSGLMDPMMDSGANFIPESGD